MKFVILIILGFFVHCDIWAQAEEQTKTPREIGLRFSGLDDLNLLYKVEKAPGYRARHRVLQAAIGYNSNNSEFKMNMGYAYGRERDTRLTDDLDFYGGIEYSLFASYLNSRSVTSRNTVYRFTPAVGFIVGLKLALSERCYLAAEIIPALSSSFTIREGEVSPFKIDFSLNSNATSLAVMYKF